MNIVSKILKYASIAYLLACLAALALMVASMFELFGVESDPLSALWAVFLSSPWSTIATLSLPVMEEFGLVTILAGMTINFSILYWLGKRLGYGAKTGEQE